MNKRGFHFCALFFLPLYLFFSLFLLVLYFTLHFVKHRENTSKMEPNLEVVELFTFFTLRLVKLYQPSARAHKFADLASILYCAPFFKREGFKSSFNNRCLQ